MNVNQYFLRHFMVIHAFVLPKTFTRKKTNVIYENFFYTNDHEMS